MKKYSLRDSRLLLAGSSSTNLAEVSETVGAALRKKLRTHNRRLLNFLSRLSEYGEATLRWRFTYKITDEDDHWVQLHARFVNGAYVIYVSGPQAENLLRKLNGDPAQKQNQKKKKSLQRQNSFAVRRARQEKKRAARLRRLQRAEQPRAKKTRRLRAPLSLERHEDLTPQFRNNRVSWREAVALTLQVFAVRQHWKYTAEALVLDELYRSLERSGYRFAQYKRAGFALRFDIVDGIWRGDITPLTVACTKDNTHPTYRRMRKRLREKLLGLSPREQWRRRVLLWQDDREAA